MSEIKWKLMSYPPGFQSERYGQTGIVRTGEL